MQQVGGEAARQDRRQPSGRNGQQQAEDEPARGPQAGDVADARREAGGKPGEREIAGAGSQRDCRMPEPTLAPRMLDIRPRSGR
jgi:hypothetical protein